MHHRPDKMKLFRIDITLPSNIGKSVVVNEQLSIEEMEYRRLKIVNTFENYGFTGALVSLSYHDCPGEIQPTIPEKFKEVKPVVEEVEPETPVEDLKQYRKYSFATFFKRK